MARRSRYTDAHGNDFAQQMYGLLAAAIPVDLRALIDNGTIAVVESRKNLPDARASSSSGRSTVSVTSGMVDFLYAINAALTGFDSARPHVRPNTSADTAAIVARLLDKWVSFCRWHWAWPWRRLRTHLDQMPSDGRDWIEMIVTACGMSILAHELGHVALDHKLIGPASNEETEADSYGLTILIPAAKRRWKTRIAFAAPIIPIRILAALERRGVQFTDRYPPQLERAQLLRAQIEATCPNKEYFHEAITIMVAYEDMLDDLGNIFARDTDPKFPDAERVVVRLLAQLEEVAKGSVSANTFASDIGTLVNAYGHENICNGLRTLRSYYPELPQAGPRYISAERRAIMGQKLMALAQLLPADLKTCLGPINT